MDDNKQAPAAATVEVPDEREAFEAWYEDDATPLEHSNWFRRDGDGDYEIDHVGWVWKGWQARAAAGAATSKPCPEGWVTEELERLFNASAGETITLDMKRAANVALKVARGESWDAAAQQWFTPPAAAAGVPPSEEIEAVIACLGDDAAQLTDENAEDERAANMIRAAELLQDVLLPMLAVSGAPAGAPKGEQQQ